MAQHLGDGGSAPEGCDLDAAAEIGRDVDREARRKMMSLRAVLRRAQAARPDPCVHVAWPRRESAFGIAARHRAIRSISAASAAASRAAGALRGISDTSRPVRAASAK